MTESQQLLATYNQTGSDAAFRELVSRYVNLVYSTALRLVDGDAHRAEDVAQVVFVDLARTAATLSKDLMLGGWLHRHTCFVAVNTMRSERRRQSRERQAVEMNVLQEQSDSNLSQFSPILDEAINELGEADRTAILLRFFEQHDFRSVGEALGSNEDAARMRVTRALEKLEALLKRRGMTTTTAALAVLLSTNSVHAAPIGLAITISAAAALTGTTTATVTTAIAMTTFQKTLLAGVVAAAVGTGIYQSRQSSELRQEIQTLQQQRGPLTEQIDRLQRERDGSVNRLAALADEIEGVKGITSELLKLRGEVARLRQTEQQSAQLKVAVSESVVWNERVEFLKQHLARNPSASIPELQYATEKDWLEAARGELTTKKDVRRAVSGLRRAMENAFAPRMQSALRGYLAANGNTFPTDISQLEPYFVPPVDGSILQRYAIFSTKMLNLGVSTDWIISQKDPVDDEFDGRLGIGPNGWGTTSFPISDKLLEKRRKESALKNTLAPVVQAYMAANGGKPPTGQAALQPFVQTPEQRTAYDQTLDLNEN